MDLTTSVAALRFHFFVGDLAIDFSQLLNPIAHLIILYSNTMCSSPDYSVFQHYSILLTRLFSIQTQFCVAHLIILYSNTIVCCSPDYFIFKHNSILLTLLFSIQTLLCVAQVIILYSNTILHSNTV